MTVSVNGTSGLTFNDATTQSTSAFFGGLGFRNRIINGSMMIDQRNAGASVTINGNALYTVDRWQAHDATDGAYTVQQSSVAPAGFVKSLLFTVTSADASLGASQYAFFTQPIEGFNTADLGWGTANAQTVTLSFWVRSSLTGTFGGSLRNDTATRSYPFTYTISAANTWEQKSITIAGDTTGTWETTNLAGILLCFGLGVGSSVSGTAGSWANSNFISSTGATSVVGTNGATFYITGVQLEKGSTATSFDYRPYGTELALCQRYYWTSTRGTYNAVGAGIFRTSTQAIVYIKHPVSMRAVPTFSYSGTVYAHGTSTSPSISSIAATYAGLDSSRLDVNTSSSATAGFGTAIFTEAGTTDFLQASAEL